MKDPYESKEYGELMSLGLEIAASVALPVVLGIYIDRNYDSSPWGVLGGTLIGLVSMALKLYKIALRSDSGRKKDPHGKR